MFVYVFLPLQYRCTINEKNIMAVEKSMMLRDAPGVASVYSIKFIVFD